MNRWLIFLLMPIVISAQTPKQIDSMETALKRMKTDTVKIQTMIDLAKMVSLGDSAKSTRYANAALKLSQNLRWNKGIAEAHYVIGSNKSYSANFTGALESFRTALKIATDKKQRSRLYLNMSSSYINLSRYPEALNNIFKALKLREELGDKQGIARAQVNLGEAYNLMRQSDKALPFLNKARSYFEQAGASKELMELYRAMAVSYHQKNVYAKAIEYFEKSLAESRLEGNAHLSASLLSDIALVYFDNAEFDKAIRYSKASIVSDTLTYDDTRNAAFSYGVIGDAYIGLAEKTSNKRMLDSAVIYLNKAVESHKEIQSLHSLLDDYTSLYKAYKIRGDHRKALEHYELAVAYQDSIFNADNRETIKNLEDKRTIELRERELRIRNLELEARERQKWVMIGGLTLLAAMGIMLFVQSRNRKKRNDQLNSLNAELDKANKIKARFFSILNHDLRRPVYNLIHFLHLQKESPELLDDESKSRIEGQTLQSAENLLGSMEDLLLWSKGQMERFKPEVEDVRLNVLFNDVEKHFSGSGVQFNIELNDKDLVFRTDRNYLLTILRNLVGNAITVMENTPNPTIKLFARSQHGVKFIRVQDNGPGANDTVFKALFDDTETIGITSGLGLHLVRDMAAAIDCKVSVDSKPGIGTTFILSFNRD